MDGDFPVSIQTRKYEYDLEYYIVYSGNINYGYRRYLIDTDSNSSSFYGYDIIKKLKKLTNNIKIEKE